LKYKKGRKEPQKRKEGRNSKKGRKEGTQKKARKEVSYLIHEKELIR
jgi:hypothetical protein